MSEANNDGAEHDDRATSVLSTDSGLSRPPQPTSSRRIPSARQPELSQIPEEAPPVPRRRQHKVGVDEDRVFLSKAGTIGDVDKRNTVGFGDSTDSLQSSKRDNQILEEMSHRSLVSDLSSHQVDGADMENGNDIDIVSVVSRRSAWSHHSHVAGSDWSVVAEPDSKVANLVQRWEMAIPTPARHLRRKDEQESNSGHVALTESALEQLSQQPDGDGVVGGFSMEEVNSNTAKAQLRAHEMKAAMAWWKDRGLDMKAPRDGLMEIPAPFATLEEADIPPSASSNKTILSDWWNKHHRFEDDERTTPGKFESNLAALRQKFQGQASLTMGPSTASSEQQQRSVVDGS